MRARMEVDVATLHKDISRPGFTPTPHAANTDIRVHSDRCNLFLFDVYTIISLPPLHLLKGISVLSLTSFHTVRVDTQAHLAPHGLQRLFFHPLTTTFCLTPSLYFFFHTWRR